MIGSEMSAARTASPDQGRESDFEGLYRRTYWLVLAYAERRLGNRETARDVAAETFRVAWQRFVGEAPISLGFLYGTCRNIIGNEYRRQLREAALVLRMGHVPGPEGRVDEGGFLREALLELKEADREILYLSYWEELSAAKIGRVLGCSESAAWARVSRARRALHKILQKRGMRHEQS